MRRALIITPNWIGDVLMAQPFFMLLKQLHHKVVLDAVAPAWVAPVLARMPEIRTIYSTNLKHGKLQLWQRCQLGRTLRGAGYEAAYVLPNSLKSALILWFSGIPLRIGYTGEKRYMLLNVLHQNPPRDERTLMVPHYAALAFAPGAKLPANLPEPHLDIDLNELVRVSNRFNLDTRVPLIAFCPGAEYGPAKRWPPEHFAALARMISQSFPYIQIIVLGSPQDQVVAQIIVKHAPNVRNLCGQTSLGEACALVMSASAVVSNDSGLMHVAAALRRPVVALYGSTDPRHTPPLSGLAKVQWLHLKCSPCFARECPLGHMNCLRELSAKQVFGDLHHILIANT
ncbi:lipopolysaccharide heptosyltransferase II [Candidatus Vallotia cooleyia]|uniref:lipopolysaccharide heptosyltransferase II n=1 Tax=Candidatus Vallotiella adelgis TaxID=1177211 RepID=UPI001D024565|nr:lipopolysaccharide heptosyltransferase II [Candidatus Vallotia cooleyia]UDG82475.1 ADP-heptose--LPS heptosyltransferase 2 [Candidatus Vallotia cooleyia]